MHTHFTTHKLSFKAVAIAVASIFLFNEIAYSHHTLSAPSRAKPLVDYRNGSPVATDPASERELIEEFQEDGVGRYLMGLIGKALNWYTIHNRQPNREVLEKYIRRDSTIDKSGLKLTKLELKDGKVILSYVNKDSSTVSLTLYLSDTKPVESPSLRFSPVSEGKWVVCEFLTSVIARSPAGVPTEGGSGRRSNLNEGLADGFVRQGTKAWEIFKKRVPVIRANKITGAYKDRIIALLERTLHTRERIGSYIRIKRRDGTFEQREEEQRRVLSQLEKALVRLKQPSFQIYGFKSIVVETNDFILDHCYWYGNELFLATDLIAWLEAHGPPDSPVVMSLLRKGEGQEEAGNTLADEFLLHTILCSVLQDHERAIIAAQGIFPGHYTNPQVGPNIVGNYGEVDGIKYKVDEHGTITSEIFKGLLGDRLRRFIDEEVRKLPLAAAPTVIAPTLTAATPILPADAIPPQPLAPAARQPAPKDSALIGGKYKIIKPLGEGGMGKVFLAEDTTLGRKVAIKTIKMIGAGDAEFIERFIREAKAVARLRHPNIIQVHEIGEFKGAPYYVMDYVEGESLDKLITPVSEGGILTSVSPFDIERIKTIAEALEYAHNQGIIHRDIKPSNIIIDKDGKPYLTDFGLAKDIQRTEGETLTATGAAVGTPQYMSPEQARGERENIDKRSDVYSLGAALYEVVTLQRPYEGEPFVVVSKVASDDPANEPPAPRSINPNISPVLEAVIMKAMAKNPDERYNSAGEFAEDLARYSRGEPTKARPLTRVKKFTRIISRNRALVIIGSIAILLILAIGSAGIYYKQLSDEKARQAQIEAQKAEEARRAAELKERIENEKQGRIKDASPHVSQARERRRVLKETAGRSSPQDYRRGLEALLDSLNKAISVYERRPQDPLIPEVLPDLPPEWAEVYLERGKTYEELGEPDKALADYKKAYELNPKLIEAYLRIGKIYEDREREDIEYREKAKEMYQRVLSIDQESDQGRLAQARLYILEREFIKALEVLNGLIRDFPLFAEAYVRRGLIISGYEGQVYENPPSYINLEQSIRDFQEYSRLNPQDVLAGVNIGWVYSRMGRFKDAEAEYNRVVENIINLPPKRRVWAVAARAMFYRDAWLGTQDPAWRDKAERDHVEMCSLDPKNIELLWRTAKFYWLTRNLEKEKEYYKKAIANGHGITVANVDIASQAENWGIQRGDIIIDCRVDGRMLRTVYKNRMDAWISKQNRIGRSYRLGITLLRGEEIIRIIEVEARPEPWGIGIEDIPKPEKPKDRSSTDRQSNERGDKPQRDDIAQRFVNAITIQSMEGHAKGKILIGIDTSWLPTKDGIQGLLSVIKDLSEPLGLDNILIAIGKDAETLARDMEEVGSGIQKGRIVILGSQATVLSPLFNDIRGEKGACFVGVDPTKLKQLEKTGTIKDARILEMIELAFELAFSGIDYTNKEAVEDKLSSLKALFPMLEILGYDPARPKTFIVIPDARELDIEEHNRINHLRAKIVSSA